MCLSMYDSAANITGSKVRTSIILMGITLLSYTRGNTRPYSIIPRYLMIRTERLKFIKSSPSIKSQSVISLIFPILYSSVFLWMCRFSAILAGWPGMCQVFPQCDHEVRIFFLVIEVKLHKPGVD